MSYKTVSIIIPLYNEAATIGQILKKVMAADTLGLKKDIVVVDDGSTDEGPAIVRSYAAKADEEANIRLITKSKNYGKGAGVRTGLISSLGDVVLIQDADLEYDPENYPALLLPIVSGRADVVYGSRFISERPHRVLYFWHYVVNVLLTLLSNMLTNLNLTDMETGYKVFRGQLVRDIAPKLQSQRFGFEPEVTAIVARVSGIRIFEVGVSYFGRTYKEGKKIGVKDAFDAIYAILRYNIQLIKR